ncbi:helix-turn-helix domain-containing protein [Candidatus Chloroploca asiatica]|uniref:Transcriptional regulator n=1 Tax=Candidatus Chloroploca asiatica TaxID=1506545 RepID=A0A2H3L4I8_9CHLR|nr:helix-turn-helix domain-containing protein [Candidatus Chloroploca asiatica]PDV97160.1 transcriptional regulator [Candidatus Chloroploca asiatica]
MEERSYFIEAALRYETLIEAGQMLGLDAFVIQEPEATRAELRAFLEFNLTHGELDEPAVLTVDQAARADHVIALVRGAWQHELSGTPVQNLTQLRQARQLTVGRLARQLTLPVDLLARLERGKVLVASVPNRLVEQLAQMLHASTSAIQAALLAPPPTTATSRLSAVDGIVEGEEPLVSFARAFAASEPTDEEQAAWAADLP